jgi:hypothetical protein
VEDRGMNESFLRMPFENPRTGSSVRPARPRLVAKLTRARRGARIEPVDRGEKRQVLVGRQLLVERRVLGREAEPSLRGDRLAPQIDVLDAHDARVGRLEPGGAAHQRALARAVGPQQPDDLTGFTSSETPSSATTAP